MRFLYLFLLLLVSVIQGNVAAQGCGDVQLDGGLSLQPGTSIYTAPLSFVEGNDVDVSGQTLSLAFHLHNFDPTVEEGDPEVLLLDSPTGFTLEEVSEGSSDYIVSGTVLNPNTFDIGTLRIRTTGVTSECLGLEILSVEVVDGMGQTCEIGIAETFYSNCTYDPPVVCGVASIANVTPPVNAGVQTIPVYFDPAENTPFSAENVEIRVLAFINGEPAVISAVGTLGFTSAIQDNEVIFSGLKNSTEPGPIGQVNLQVLENDCISVFIQSALTTYIDGTVCPIERAGDYVEECVEITPESCGSTFFDALTYDVAAGTATIGIEHLVESSNSFPILTTEISLGIIVNGDPVEMTVSPAAGFEAAVSNQYVSFSGLVDPYSNLGVGEITFPATSSDCIIANLVGSISVFPGEVECRSELGFRINSCAVVVGGRILPTNCTSDIGDPRVVVLDETDMEIDERIVTGDRYLFPLLSPEARAITIDRTSASAEPDLSVISTADLVQITRHIFGIESFSSRSQFIAADAFQNEILNIGILDIIDIRRVILGLDDGFGITDESPQPKNFYFPLASFLPTVPANIGSLLFPTKFIPTSEMGLPQVGDFAAILIGDVTGANGCAGEENFPTINLEGLVSASGGALKKGKTKRIPITIKDFNKLSILDFAFRFDQKSITLNRIGSGDLEMVSGSNYAIDKKAGTARGIWSPESIKEAEEPQQKPFQFYLEVTALEDVEALSKVISLMEGEENNLIYPLDFKEGTTAATLATEGKTVTQSMVDIDWINQEETEGQEMASSVSPVQNPIDNELVLEVTSVRAQPAEVNLLSLTGKTVARLSTYLIEGENRIRMNNLGHLSPGVYLYRFNDAMGNIHTGKVIKQ